MCGITGAIIGGGIIGAGASIIGADKQADAARDASRLSQDQFQTINRQQQPFIQPGYAATSRLSHLLGLSGPPQISATPPGSPSAAPTGGWMRIPEQGGLQGGIAGSVQAAREQYGAPPDWATAWRGSSGPGGVSVAAPGGAVAAAPDGEFGSLLRPFDAETFNQYKDPGYQFRLKQGEQAVRNAAAAGSGALSGAALKDLLMYNQDAASTEYGNAFNRYQTQQGNIFSRLSGIAQLGQSAAAGVGQQGTALAGQAGQALTNAGTAAGAGIVGAGNAIGGAASNYWLSKLVGGG